MRTLANRGRAEIEIKRSRFVAHAGRVDSESETRPFLESVRDPAATHNCWAWKLDQDYRFNDDGEPASTAGRPILAAIEGKELAHTMVVVTRHFGGVKLGAGGLVRAYSAAAARAIEAAGSVEEAPTVDFSIEVAYDWTGQLYAVLEGCGAQRLEESYPAGGVRILARVSESELEELARTLRDATRGEAVFRRLD